MRWDKYDPQFTGFNPVSAPKRYFDMGFPEEYKVTIEANYSSGGYTYGWHSINLYQWRETFTRFRKKSEGFSWVLVKYKIFSTTSVWTADEPDSIAKNWLFELNRMKKLRKQD